MFEPIAPWKDSPPAIPGVLFSGAVGASNGGGSSRCQPAFTPASSHRPLAARIDFGSDAAVGELWSSAPWSATAPMTPDERLLRAEERGRLARLQQRREAAAAERQEDERAC